MNYAEAENYLYDLQLRGTKLGLENTRALLSYLSNPNKNLFFIHIAGTNGKGSVCAILNSILTSAGFRTGIFTSPHLISLRERLKINNSVIQPRKFAKLTKTIKRAVKYVSSKNYSPTFFEAITAMAIHYFCSSSVDIVLWETGMGGTYDATNVVDAPVSIITNVGLDHCQLLGTSTEKIALDKAGIIKPNTYFLTGSENPAVNRLFSDICKRKTATMISTSEQTLQNTTISLSGQTFDYHSSNDECWSNLHTNLIPSYQRKNIALAIEATRIIFSLFKKRKPSQNIEQCVRNGLKKVIINGRFQRISSNPLIIVDVAHNPDGTHALRTAITETFRDKKITLMIGLLADKDHESICKIIAPVANRIFCLTPPSARSLNASDLASVMRTYVADDIPVHHTYTFEQSIEIFRNDWDNTSSAALVIFGSFYLIGEILKKWRKTRLKIFDKESDYR